MVEHIGPPAQAETPEVVKEATVIDTDVHVELNSREMIEDRASHFENEIHKRLFRESMLKEEGVPGVRMYPSSNFSSTIPGKMYAIREEVHGPKDVEPQLEELGIDYAIINNVTPFNLTDSAEKAVQDMRGINNVILDYFLQESEKLFGVAHLQTRDPEEAANEIDRLSSEERIVGAHILNGTTEKPLGHPRYHPIYEAAEANGLPVVFHSSGALTPTMPHNPVRGWGFRNALPAHALTHPFVQMETVTSLIFEAVPEKYPDLKFLVNESGLGFVPYLMGRLNREHGEWGLYARELQKTPEEYVRDHFFFSTQPLPETNNIQDTRDMLSAIGAQNITFSSDYPHIDFDHLGSVVNKYFPGFSRGEKELVLGGNAAELFDIK